MISIPGKIRFQSTFPLDSHPFPQTLILSQLHNTCCCLLYKLLRIYHVNQHRMLI